MSYPPTDSSDGESPEQSFVASDEMLLLGTRLRDEDALAALYERYGAAVFTLALRIVGDHDLAEAVTQDVFLRCWHGLEQYNSSGGPIRAWLLDLTRKRATERLPAGQLAASRDRLQDDELQVEPRHEDVKASAFDALDADDAPTQSAPVGSRDRLLDRARAERGGPPTVEAPTVMDTSDGPTGEWSAGGPPPAADRPWHVGDEPPDPPTADDREHDRREADTVTDAAVLPPRQAWEPPPSSRLQPIPAAPLPPRESRPRSQSQPRFRLTSIASAAALAFVLAVGLIVTAWSATGPHASVSVEIGSRLPGGRILPLAGTGAPTAQARLFVVGEGRQAELVADALPALANGRVYQLWFAEPGQPIRTGGTFLVNQQGDAAARVTIPAPLDRVTVIAITEEAAPRSPEPTGAHVLDWVAR